MLGFIPLHSNKDGEQLGNPEDSQSIVQTKEALTNKWFMKYNATLKKHREAKTIETRQQLISSYVELISKEGDTKNESIELSPPMYFSVLKNLAVLQEAVGDVDAALTSLSAATDFDQTDVALWYRISGLALDTKRFRLARHAIDCALRANPTHLPSLNRLPKVVNALNSCEKFNSRLADNEELRGFRVVPHHSVGITTASWAVLGETILATNNTQSHQSSLILDIVCDESKDGNLMDVDDPETKEISFEIPTEQTTTPAEEVTSEKEDGPTRRSRRQESKRHQELSTKETLFQESFLAPLLELLKEGSSNDLREPPEEIQEIGDDNADRIREESTLAKLFLGEASVSQEERGAVREYLSTLAPGTLTQQLTRLLDHLAALITTAMLAADECARTSNSAFEYAQFGVLPASFKSTLPATLSHAARLCRNVMQPHRGEVSVFSLDVELLIAELDTMSMCGSAPELTAELLDASLARIDLLVQPDNNNSRQAVLSRTRLNLLRADRLINRGLVSAGSEELQLCCNLIGDGCLMLPHQKLVDRASLRSDIEKLNTLDVVPSLRQYIHGLLCDKIRQLGEGGDSDDCEKTRTQVLLRDEALKNKISVGVAVALTEQSASVLSLVLDDLVTFSPHLIAMRSGKRLGSIGAAPPLSAILSVCTSQDNSASSLAINNWATHLAESVGSMSILGVWLQSSSSASNQEKLLVFLCSAIRHVLRESSSEGGLAKLEGLLRIICVLLWRHRSWASDLCDPLTDVVVTVVRLVCDSYCEGNEIGLGLLNLALSSAYFGSETLRRTGSRSVAKLLIGLFNHGSYNVGVCSIIGASLQHLRSLPAFWTSETAENCPALQTSLVQSLVSFLSYLAELDLASPSVNKSLLSLRASASCALVCLITPRPTSSGDHLFNIFPGLTSSSCPWSQSSIAMLLDNRTRLELCTLLREFLILNLHLGDSELELGKDSEGDSLPLLALLEVLMNDLFSSLPCQFPAGFLEVEETPENTLAESSERVQLVCALVRDLYHLRLLPQLEDHKLKWADPELKGLRGSQWSLPMPLPLALCLTRLLLPLLHGHEEQCRGVGYRCPCWPHLLPQAGFAKTQLDDQRMLLEALFRTDMFWWPCNSNGAVLRYLMDDLTLDRVHANAHELGRLLELTESADNRDQDWATEIRKHLYRLLLERTSGRKKRPGSQKEHEAMELEIAQLCRASLFALSFDPTHTEAWCHLAQSWGLLQGCISDSFDASSSRALALSPEATQVATSCLLRLIETRHNRKADRLTDQLEPLPNSIVELSTCTFYRKDSNLYHEKEQWKLILAPIISESTQASLSVKQELVQFGAQLQLEEECVSKEIQSQQCEALAALALHAYRVLSLRSFTMLAVCYARHVGLKSWKPLPLQPLSPDVSTWPLQTRPPVEGMTQIELSGCSWEVESDWNAPGPGVAAASQMPLLIQCLELISFSLYEDLQDYPRCFLPAPDPSCPSAAGFGSWSSQIEDSFPLESGGLGLSAVFSCDSPSAVSWRQLRERKIVEALALTELVCRVSVSPFPLSSSSQPHPFPVLEVRTDGSEDEYSESVGQEFDVDSRVEAQWRHGSLYYPGRVSRKHQGVVGDGTLCYDILYDDGEFEREVPFTLVRGPAPLVRCLAPRPWGVVVLRAKLLSKRQRSISDVSGWRLILDSYRSIVPDSKDRRHNKYCADEITALSLLHRCRLKLIVRWLRTAVHPPSSILDLLEQYSYQPLMGPNTDFSLDLVRRRLLMVLNDIATALEYCIAVSPYHHRSVVALASVLAERRRAEVVLAPAVTQTFFIPVADAELPKDPLELLAHLLGVSFIRDALGSIVVAKLHGRATPPSPPTYPLLSLQDALDICGQKFPDRKGKHSKNKLKLRRSSTPCVFSEGLFSSGHAHIVTGFGLGLAERSVGRKCWLSRDIRVGDIVAEVDGEDLEGWLQSGAVSTCLEVKLIRRQPSLVNSIPAPLPPELIATSSEGGEESSTQSKTQVYVSENESEGGLSDLEDMVEDGSPTKKRKLLTDNPLQVDIDLKRQTGSTEAAQCLHRLFAKKLPQLVGIWARDLPESPWEELCGRRRNFDKLRLNYTAHFLTTLTCDVGSAKLITDESALESSFRVSLKHRLKVRDTLERLLGYLLNMKDAKRDRVGSLLTGSLLGALGDISLCHSLDLLGGEPEKAEIESLLSTSYDKYLVATDPNVFPFSAPTVEKRCAASLMSATRLHIRFNLTPIPCPSSSTSSSSSICAQIVGKGDADLRPKALLHIENEVTSPTSTPRRRWSLSEKECLKRAVGVHGELGAWNQVWELCGVEEPGMKEKWAPQELSDKWKKMKIEITKQQALEAKNSLTLQTEQASKT